MEDVVAQLKEAADGMTPEEISSALSACPNVPADKVDALASWIASLNA